MNTHFIPAVAICDWSESLYPCFVANPIQTWNGWAMPFFTLEVAKHTVLDIGDGITFNVEKDCFVWNDGDELVDFTTFTINYNGEEIKLYDVGAGYFCWELQD